MIDSNTTKLIITGGVGVGKTTAISNICNTLTNNGLKYKIIPEFIDGDENGIKMLDKSINHEISAYEFQLYILQYFDKYLGNLKVDDNEILIFERLPDDSVTCFVNIDVKKGLITNDEFKKLFDICINIDKKYNLPSYFTEFMNNDLLFCKSIDKNTTTDIIYTQLKESIKKHKNLLVGLYNTNEECLKRIRMRNRKSEVDTYNGETINIFNKHYERIYKLLGQKQILTFDILHDLID